MSIGPGKYDHLLTRAIAEAKATSGILIIFDGVLGPSWCTQATLPTLVGVPTVLREMADAIERDLQKGKL